MNSYLVHSSRERARFRHPIFSNDGYKQQAVDVLKKFKGIVGLKAGPSSILIYFDQDTQIEPICKKLEEIFPELQANDEDKKPKKIITPKNINPHSSNHKRQLLLKTLLTSGITTVGLAAIGLHHLHAFAGGIFAILATHHVWERRKRIF